MIRKNNKDLLNWIYQYVLDFTDENDTSPLTWESTQEDALRFLHSIPQKERVQEYGFFSSRSHFFLVKTFDDIEEGLQKGFISELTCKKIYRWNSEVECENWNMSDVNKVLYPEIALDDGIKQKFVSNTFLQLKKLGLIECVNPEAKHGKLYRLTEKGVEIFGDI